VRRPESRYSHTELIGAPVAFRAQGQCERCFTEGLLLLRERDLVAVRPDRRSLADLGLLSFLIGLLLLLVPTAWSSGATLAFAIGLLALVIELRWTGTWFSRLRWTRVVKPLDETLKPVTLRDLDPMSQSAVLTDVQSQSQASSEQATPSA
jgi:hypothetical protein